MLNRLTSPILLQGVFYRGQAGWPWARERITAGFVLDLCAHPAVGKALLFFHGTGPDTERIVFSLNFASECGLTVM
ncbi:hypothetical protein DB346_01550 [Verrucomicrobia bacterium LW23]|nr:hypothetical protein DB346_01550 [Verrucomicrobia bacterium LW23]